MNRIQGDKLAVLVTRVAGAELGRGAGSVRARLALGLVCLALVLVLGPGAECASLGTNPAAGDADSLANQPKQSQMAPLRPTMSRFRRQASSSFNTKLQQLELDEQTMKRQLPELIAQAHQDKSIERALLKMLISASLRSNLDTTSAPQRATSGGWQLASDTPANLMEGGELVPGGRLQGRSDYGGENSPLSGAELSSLIATIDQFNSGQLQPLDQSLLGSQQPYSMMDKREYIKPCSFNAISCVRTPFRKL